MARRAFSPETERQILQEYIEGKETTIAMGQRYCCDPSTICLIARRQDRLATNKRRQNAQRERAENAAYDFDVLCLEYAELAEKYCEGSQNAMRRYVSQLRSQGYIKTFRSGRTKAIPCDRKGVVRGSRLFGEAQIIDIARLVYDERCTKVHVARRYGCGVGAIYNALRLYNELFPTSRSGR